MITDKNKDFLSQYGSKKHIDTLLDDNKNQNKHFVVDNHLFDENHVRKFLSSQDREDYDDRTIFKSKSVPKDIIDSYVNSNSFKKMTTVANSPNLTREHIDTILSSEHEMPKRQLLSNKHVMKNHKDFILEHPVAGKYMTKEYVKNYDLKTTGEHEKYVNHSDPEIRGEVAKQHRIPIEHQETLSRDPNKSVRAKYAMNNVANLNILRTMMKDPNEDETIKELAKINSARRGQHYYP